MTKQKEIREGAAERIYRWYFRNSYLNDLGEWNKVNGATRGMILAITDIVLEYEDSQGVVIKVDRELPKIPFDELHKNACFAYTLAQQDILKAGYVVVEPLINEG